MRRLDAMAAGVMLVAATVSTVTPVDAPGSAPTPDPAPDPITPTAPGPGPLIASGDATWYCLRGRSICHRAYPDRPGIADLYAAAGPRLRRALGSWRGKAVTVWRGPAQVTVRLIDWCACPGGRVIDLYADAFRRLAPLGLGEIGVAVRSRGRLPGPTPMLITLPPTDR